MRIVAENLNYVYSEKTNFAAYALKNVNLTIEEGEFFGIIGRTGSGKSTFVQHLNGLIKIGKKKGSLTVGEFNLADKKCNFKELRKKVGMVFQYPEYQLFAETVFDDVAFGLKNFDKNMPKDQIEGAVRYALDLVGLDYDQIKDKSPFELSGGQKRRVAIAGVIVTRPEILVLDEPASGLDPQGKKDLFELIERLREQFVKTVIIVSHDMDAVLENCTKVAVFDDGEVVKVGKPSEVFADEEELLKVGLDAPSTVRLTAILKEKGINIDSDYSLTGFVDGVVKAKGGLR